MVPSTALRYLGSGAVPIAVGTGDMGFRALQRIWSWRYGVRVQPPSTASRAGDMEFGLSHALHQKEEVEKEEGVAPLFKSRDFHLAGGEQEE